MQDLGEGADNGFGATTRSMPDVGGWDFVVYSLSRLARSTRDTIEIADRLDRDGADSSSLSERIDTTTAAGKMAFRMMAVLAEFETRPRLGADLSALAHKRT